MARVWLSDLKAMSAGSALLQAGNGYNPYKKAFVDSRNPLSRVLAASVTAIQSAQSVGVASGLSTSSTGVPLAWITAPFLATATIPAEPVLVNINTAAENAGDANVGIRLRLAEFIEGTGEQSVFLSSTTNSAELGSTGVLRWETSNPTATAIEAGNRLVIRLDTITLDTSGTSRFATVNYDGPREAEDGDTYIDLNEVIRVNQSQLAGGSTAMTPGIGHGGINDALTTIAFLQEASLVASNTTLQCLQDELGYQANNN